SMIKFKVPNYSPFMNNAAQALEILICIDRVIAILSDLELKDEQPIEVKPCAGVGVAASEAPRGILFHKYEFDDTGHTIGVNITTPTSQNLTNLQLDLNEFLPTLLGKPQEEIIMQVEKLIRAYDPCISCATHFLKVDWKET
ncbi:MAG: nickel-dependent hydrogenase large subunit, partial [Nanoarchaeota archaeon]|nr:nickel-dependent hydrogenase large subunit [Nanoarchaeota archaeon]